ncbi:hypothetical protein CC80DRAFT_488569 [Byssothecium circinans]|uniref:Uncharacterized protein n=1 Tax=Byssothecium circinans TaxID=147558 RepID=A0A6A5UEC9_9PLEO|nr:hypothetical protein CC80DRAFT_488569 [Byssothecium circinans]
MVQLGRLQYSATASVDVCASLSKDGADIIDAYGSTDAESNEKIDHKGAIPASPRAEAAWNETNFVVVVEVDDSGTLNTCPVFIVWNTTPLCPDGERYSKSLFGVLPGLFPQEEASAFKIADKLEDLGEEGMFKVEDLGRRGSEPVNIMGIVPRDIKAFSKA